LRISRQLLDEVVAHARAEAPRECCGMIAASDGHATAVHRARNDARSPKLRYEMNGQDQYDILVAIEDAGSDVGAIYHSHPRTEPVPSQTDINLADGWPEPLYVIVGLEHPEPDVRAWRIVDGAASEATLEVDDGPAAD
jgi:[CysO sulfur-carrier protein]-S-L-cysteine hydrolase